jgi:hypothetical protein
MCLAAEAAGCTTQNFTMTANCRIGAFWDTPAWTTLAQIPTARGPSQPFYYRQPQELDRQELSCAARQGVMQRNGWSFYANELYLPCATLGSGGGAGSGAGSLAGGAPQAAGAGGWDGKAVASEQPHGRSLAAQRSFGIGALNFAPEESSSSSSSSAGDGTSSSSENSSSSGNDGSDGGTAAAHESPAAGSSSRAGGAGVVDTGSCLCGDAANVIIVRDPLKRAVAHLKHIAAHHIHVGCNLWRNTSFLLETSHMAVRGRPPAAPPALPAWWRAWRPAGSSIAQPSSWAALPVPTHPTPTHPTPRR